MATVPTRISKIKLNLSDQNKRVLSDNISTKTKELISEYNNYTDEVIGELKDTSFYKNLSETVQSLQDSEAYKNTQAAISNGVENAFSIFDDVDEDNGEEHVSNNVDSNITSSDNINSETKTETKPVSNSTPTSGKKMEVPSGDTSFKSYTNYRKVTNKSTPAYAVVNGLTSPYGKFAGTKYNTQTDPETGVRYVTFEGDDNKYYCAAMGTYYGEVGDTFKVTTDKGNTYHVIMCDAKGTDAQGKKDGKSWYHTSGSGSKCVTEFYMDYPAEEMRVYGSDGSYKGTTGTYDSVSQFSGNITSVEKLS